MNVHVAPKLATGGNSSFARDAIDGLTHSPKRLPPKYFYDSVGSKLFEQITRLPEYYPTRTELSILDERATDIAGFIPANAALVEFGAGSTTKVRKLLRHGGIAAYVPVDISGDFLEDQARRLRGDFPALGVYPVIADFTAPFALPPEVAGMPNVGFFPGSTLGNFEPADAAAFLRRAATILGKSARMLLGVDLEKDESTLSKAYNDDAGVTAQFNLNVLSRMNRELDANFDLDAFDHKALYNRDEHRIEMHLFSRKAQEVTVCGHTIRFARNESIHTENSYKYSVTRFTELAKSAGWSVDQSWTDKNALFSLHALRTR